MLPAKPLTAANRSIFCLFARGPANYSQPKIFVASYVYPLPFWQHEHDWYKQALGGWQDVISSEVHDFLKLAIGVYVPTVNLKQFRDEEDNTLACYQSLVDCEAQMTKLKGAGLLPGKYELSVTPCESHQVEADLGLSNPVGDGRYSVRFAFWVNMDFPNPPGRRIWKAS